ncbi:hypothetical protein [Frigoribacterium faeni]|uniref:hypothetical protein n=1 Tax=Frigoribacterium faeni TaxID=145483 RepID=UPI00141BDBA4|nr:hypothetical protein [Frigoribacterium faeni]NIJ05002.1 hypothetical protein [Frigoribacterium faeni]
MTDARGRGRGRRGEFVDLARELTEALRAVEGVVDVLDARPVVAAVRAVAGAVDGRRRHGLVEVERSGRVLSVTASVATDAALPTPETLARAAEVLRDHAGHASDSADDEVVVSVTARVVEPSPGR